MKKHKHHIIPRHAGGTDHKDNIIELTVEEHAEAHRQLYEKYGRWQDRVAWLSLSGIMKDQERIYEIMSNANRGNPSGFRHSEDHKKYMSEIRTGDKNPQFGKPAPNRGVKRPGIGGRNAGTKWSEQERQVHEAIRSQPGYYDFTQCKERNRKISEAKKGKPGAAIGKTWYTDGGTETYATECPQGFRKGRKPGRNSNKKGMRWFNNGTENRQFREGDQLEGYIRGRISKK
jgi:hypothetical protein